MRNKGVAGGVFVSMRNTGVICIVFVQIRVGSVSMRKTGVSESDLRAGCGNSGS
jgi:hypothetical protein